MGQRSGRGKKSYASDEIELMKNHDVNYVRDKGRNYVEIKTPDQLRGVFGDNVRFRAEYMDVNGQEQHKTPEGAMANYTLYTPEQLIALSQGKPVDVEYTTTSNVVHTETQMLAKTVTHFGKVALRPMDVTKINDMNMFFDKEVYEKAVADIKSNFGKNQSKAIDSVMSKASMLKDDKESYNLSY